MIGLAPIKTVVKLWGCEVWYANEPEYCMKMLVLHPGFSSSLHYHLEKKETFIIKKGWCMFQQNALNMSTWTEPEKMELGNFVVIYPKRPHRFFLPSGNKSCVIYEVSTHHDDRDVVRLVESHKMEERCLYSQY